MLAIVAPGQGAQTPGFLAPWLGDDESAARLSWLSAVATMDLVEYGVRADAATIRDTAVAQPLLVAAGLVALHALTDTPSSSVLSCPADVVAGHSVGEIVAAAAAGVFTEEQAMVFVRERGRQMAAATAVRPTSMTAVVGGDRDEVLAVLAACGLEAANHNGQGQIVAAGTVEQLDALAAKPPARARLVPLSVAGAFHTAHMRPARDHLAGLTRTLVTHDPVVRLLTNADGRVVAKGRDYLGHLVRQVASPVRWDLCLATMADLRVTGLLELPPAGTLAGLAKRNLPGVESFALDSPGQVPQARAFVARHLHRPRETRREAVR